MGLKGALEVAQQFRMVALGHAYQKVVFLVLVTYYFLPELLEQE